MYKSIGIYIRMARSSKGKLKLTYTQNKTDHVLEILNFVTL